MFDDAALEKEQTELLSLLAEAARKVPREKRGKFLFVEAFGGASIVHPGLSDWSLKAYKGDIEVLAQKGFLLLSYTSRDSIQFDITSRGFKYYDERECNPGLPIDRFEMMAIQLYGLDQRLKEILRDILDSTQSTGTGVDATYYRAQHDDQLDVLDKLQKNGFLRKELDKYWVSLYGLTLLDSEKAKALVENFEKIFSELKKRYKEKPKDKVMVADLANLSNLTFKETAECLGYMIQAHWLGGYTNSFDNPSEAYIQPSEEVLRHKSFKEIIAGVIRLQTEREAQSPQYVPGQFFSAYPHETNKEVDQITNLAFIHSNGQWVINELEKLMAEWKAWSREVDQIVDQPYDRNTHSEVYSDGESMMQKHEILQSKTLVFLSKNVRGHGFITGFDGSHIDRTDLRLKHRVKHRIQNLRVLRACLDAIQSEEKTVGKVADKSFTSPDAHKDIFQIKPTFFGISIDLKALWRKWRSMSGKQ